MYWGGKNKSISISLNSYRNKNAIYLPIFWAKISLVSFVSLKLTVITHQPWSYGFMVTLKLLSLYLHGFPSFQVNDTEACDQTCV